MKIQVNRVGVFLGSFAAMISVFGCSGPDIFSCRQSDKDALCVKVGQNYVNKKQMSNEEAIAVLNRAAVKHHWGTHGYPAPRFTEIGYSETEIKSHHYSETMIAPRPFNPGLIKVITSSEPYEKTVYWNTITTIELMSCEPCDIGNKHWFYKTIMLNPVETNDALGVDDLGFLMYSLLVADDTDDTDEVISALLTLCQNVK
jgi:hypothetical protein